MTNGEDCAVWIADLPGRDVHHLIPGGERVIRIP